MLYILSTLDGKTMNTEKGGLKEILTPISPSFLLEVILPTLLPGCGKLWCIHSKGEMKNIYPAVSDSTEVPRLPPSKNRILKRGLVSVTYTRSQIGVLTLILYFSLNKTPPRNKTSDGDSATDQRMIKMIIILCICSIHPQPPRTHPKVELI